MRDFVQSSFVLLILCISFWRCSNSTGHTSRNEFNTHKYALLIGIDKYKNVNGLRGCKNDVREMKQMLIDKFSFPENNIITLLDNQATHQSIVDAFLKVVSQIDTGATFLFEFSGHGSQQVDTSETEINGLSEILIPYDYDFVDGNPGVYGISDSELHGLIKLLSAKTKNITVILDACHSAGATKNLFTKRSLDNIDTRQYHKPLSFSVNKISGERGLSGIGSEKLPYVLIAGCASEESAYEYESSPNNIHGILTYYLLQGLHKIDDSTTYIDLMNNVKTLVAEKFNLQHPVLAGANANSLIFGANKEWLSNYLLISPSGIGTVKLEGGKELGITKNSIFDVYSPGTKDFSGTVHPVAKIKITTVRDSDCDGDVIEGKVDNNNSLGIQREHYFKSQPLNVIFKGQWQTSGMNDLKKSLLSDSEIVETNQENEELIFDLTNNRLSISLAGYPTAPINVFNLTMPGIKDSLDTRLKLWSKWFNVLSIENPSARLSISFSMFKAGDQQKGESKMSSHSDNIAFKDGDSVYFQIANNSDSDLYFFLIDLVDNGAIHPYPITQLMEIPQAANELIPAHGSWKKGLFIAAIENNGKKEKDILKLFGTRDMNLKVDFLLQKAIDGSESRGIFSPFNLFDFNSKGVRPSSQTNTPLSSWVIVDKAISINN